MSQSVYPTLPGLGWSFIRTPMWKTGNSESASGRTFAIQYQTYPRYKYRLTYEVLREQGSYTELQTLMGFFNLMKGSFDSFLFTDPDDNSVTLQVFGTGDGSTTQFQLIRTRGGFIEPIFDVSGVPAIFINGTFKAPGTDYTLGPTGIVTFVTAPAAAASLTWTGSYFFRCAFTTDSTDFEQFYKKLWLAGTVEFQTRKQ